MIIPDLPFDGPFSRTSDEELCELYKDTEYNEIIAELFRRYAHLVIGVCYNYFHNREDARDGLMDIFVKLPGYIRKYEIRNFKSWLFTITRTHCALTIRQNRRMGSSVEWIDNLMGDVMENGGFLNLISAEQEEQYKMLHKAIGELTPGQQQCIMMFYLDGMPYIDIERQTGFTFKEVKSHIQNGKRNLKNKLESYFDT